ncbi:MAG: DEAD/DEAH box helicase, partial [Lachnospiraceae bacterium]|nr:DEAD/DEAH box helicase [Lachnospiraceae bacterium]
LAFPKQGLILRGVEEMVTALDTGRTLALTGFDSRPPMLHVRESFLIEVQPMVSYQGNFQGLVSDLRSYLSRGYSAVLLCPSRTRGSRMAEELREYGIKAYFEENREEEVAPGTMLVTGGHLHRGFTYPQLKFMLLTEGDILGQKQKKRRKPKFEGGQKIRSFSELSVGDYVVHENYGIGIYRGIVNLTADDVARDYMQISYGNSGTLYIPVTNLDVVQKYANADAKPPKLNRLDSPDWKRTKTRVKQAVEEVAEELVELYALRQNGKGFVYGTDTVWQREFEEMFPYEETEDQVLAIEAVKADMESDRIMDRLICGDVGFGKTEVALRAAFKAVQDSKQVAYLVPTTILAQQHYNTFVQRLGDFPVRVELLSRFRTPDQQKAAIAALKKGETDIVIGTHRILSKDVSFRDLGLLIIDEEQRFGVRHKEQIKQMKKSVDVLTLSATPIPRTLHMSMIGVRDMSVLSEPPTDRLAIQTYVMEYAEELVREAVNREFARGGQVYYVYNRVQDIADVAARLQSLVPDAEVSYAHGKLSERELEKRMLSFIEGEIDVLVSTTIIETGLDIPNVNTMIVHDADRYGLAQLYQLRGRVGRSNRTAYAFL